MDIESIVRPARTCRHTSLLPLMNSSSSSPAPANAARHYSTENLTYTRTGLLALSFWLLWGDFAFNFFESVFGRFLPIYLKDLQASNTLIGLMGGSFDTT